MIPLIIRTFKIALGNLEANREICLVTVVIITVALSILGLFFLIVFNLDSVSEAWNRQVRLVVYLNDDVTRQEQRSLERIIANNSDVEFSEFISKEMAWENFKKTFSGKTDVIETLDFNPLPSSLVLQFQFGPKRFEKIQRFAEELKKQSGVESLEYGEKWLSRFEKFMVFTKVFLMILGGLLSMGLILIVSNAIKLSVYSRREEVELMMLIGARIQFIKGPFLLEGVIQALAGGISSLIIIRIFFSYMKYQFDSMQEFFLRGITMEFFSFQGVVFIIFMSMVIGWLGSWISISHFLRSELKM